MKTTQEMMDELEKEYERSLTRQRFISKVKVGVLMTGMLIFLGSLFLFLSQIGPFVRTVMGVE